MKNRSTGRWILCFFLMVTSLLTSCTSGNQLSTQPSKPPQQPAVEQPQPATPQTGGELVIASPGTLPPFDPFGVSKQKAELNDFEWLAYRGLLAYAEDQRLVPQLASTFRVERVNGKPVVELALRQGAVWSDGKPVTVDDVVFTYETYANPYYYGVWRNKLHLLHGISPFRTGKAPHVAGIAADAKQGVVRFMLERDDVTFFQALTAPLLPKHQLAGKRIGELDAMSRAGAILGVGPFQVKSLNGNGWQFISHAAYYGVKPHLASIRVVPVSPSDAVQGVSDGRFHWSWVTPETARSLLNAPHPQARVISGAARGYHFLGFNLQSKPLSDPAVRRALVQALNPEEIAKNSFFGLAEEVDSPLPQHSFAHAAGSFPFRQPSEARAALTAKGYSTNHPLVLTLVYPSGNEVRERLVQALLAAWQELPVRIEKKPLAHDQFVAYLFGGSATDLYLYAWEYPRDPAELIELWHSREKVGELGFNASRYANPQADQLLERGQSLLAEAERKQLFVEWQRLFAADLPIAPLLQLPNHYYISARLHGVAERLGARPFEQMENWWLQ